MTSKNLKNFEFRLGRQGILLFVVSMSLLLFLIFILGVIVGMHIDAYPENIARVMPQMIRKQIERSLGKTIKPAPVEEAKSLPANDEGTTEATMSSLMPPKEEGPKMSAAMDNKELAPILVQPSHAAADKASGNQIPSGFGGESDPKTSVTVKGEQGLPDSTKASSERPATVAGKYALQVASFKEQEKAEQFCNKIRPLGYEPRVAMINLPKKGKWFRVFIEGFQTKEEARKAASILSGKIKGVNSIIRAVK